MLNLMCSANTMLNKMEIHAKIFFKSHHTDFDSKFIDHFYTKPFFNLVILCVLQPNQHEQLNHRKRELTIAEIF